MPQISVVMTVYNGALYLKEAIDSVLNQTSRDFEFIIVDNHSSDKTVEIIKSYQDPRIILIENPQNLGQTKALNVGMRRAQAAYIARMDADDICDPTRFALQYEFLKRNFSVVVVGSWCIDINTQGKQMNVFKAPMDPMEIRASLAGSGDLTSWCISHPTAMMRRDALEAVGFYNENAPFSGYPQDYDLWSRLALKEYQFANIPAPLLKYRVLAVSESRGPDDQLLRFRLDISRQKVRHYQPSLAQARLENLAHMLEYQRLPFPGEVKYLWTDFDQYFRAFMTDNCPVQLVEALRDQLKFYYLPILFKTHKLLSLSTFFLLCILRPGFIFDKKFYRKIIKVFLNSVLSGPRYSALKRKLALR